MCCPQFAHLPASWHCSAHPTRSCSAVTSAVCSKQQRKLEESGVVEARRQLEARAEARAKEHAAAAAVAERERRQAQFKKDVAMQRELTLQQHMKQVLCRCRLASCAMPMLNACWAVAVEQHVMVDCLPPLLQE